MVNNRIIVAPGSAVGAILGTYDIFGTATGAETVTVFDDTIVRLQSDFNRGGDTLRLRDVASDFQIVRQGSNVILTSISDAITVSVPVGVAGIRVIFEDSAGQLTDERLLLFNGTNVVLGSQIIGLSESQVSGGLNVAPVITSPASVTIDENAPASDVVYLLTATDANVGQTLTYSLAGTDAALFTINSTTGEVRLRQSANFETKQSYAISVQASDGVATTTQALNVLVRNLVDDLEIGGGGDSSISIVDARGTAADFIDVNYRFLERTADANDVVITHFSANDVLSFDSPLSGYSFSTNNNDLVIAQNANGVISRIVIQGIGNSTQFVFDAASADEAINQVLGTANASYLVVGSGAANSAPVAVIAAARVTEDATIFGRLTATDLNVGAVLSFALNAPIAGLTVAPDGSFTFDGSHPAYQSLSAGQTKDVVANFTVTDDKGATAQSTLTITVTGVNDAPVTQAVTAKVFEDATVAGQLVATDVDNGAVLTYALDAPVTGLSIFSDGKFTLDASNAAYQSLAAGQTKDVVANFTVTDDKGATSKSTLTVAITGVNDAPIAAATTASGAEDATATGRLTAVDVDSGAVLSFALDAPVAGLMVETNGIFTFDGSNGAYQNLAAGVTKNVVGKFTVTDNFGATAQSTLTLNVVGRNDAPTVNIPIPDQTVATGNAWSFAVPANSFVDVDNDVLSYLASLAGGAPLPSWLIFNPATRTFSGAVPSTAQNLSISVSASDSALSVSDTFVLAVGGVTQDIRGLVFSTVAGTTTTVPQLSFSVLLSSIFSQANSISLLYWAVDSEQTWISIARDPASGLFNSSLNLGAFAKSGSYAVRLITAQDNFGDTVSFNESQIAAMGLTPTTTLQNARSDSTAPSVASFSIGSIAKNASGQFEVNFAVSASDAQSGLKDSFIIELLSPSGKSLQQFFNFNGTGAANPVFLLDPLSPSGTYRVNTIRLTDNAGNGNLSQDFLATVPSTLVISNPSGDNALPVLSSFSISAMQDAQSGRPIVTIKLGATDNLSGIDRVLIGIKDQNGIISQQDLHQGVSTSVNLAGEVAFPIGTSSTAFEVDFLLISDKAGNQVRLSNSDLSNLGFQVATQIATTMMSPADSWTFG